MNTPKSRPLRPAKVQYWTDILNKYEASGMSQYAFARAHKVSPGSLSRWGARLRNEQSSPPIAHTSPRVLPVEVLHTPSALCEIVLSSGTFRFPASIPAQQLRELLRVLTTVSSS